MSQKKRCPLCERWKRVKDFNKNASKKDGLQSDCRKCTNTQAALRELKNAGNYTDRLNKSLILTRRLELLIDGQCIREIAKSEAFDMEYD